MAAAGVELWVGLALGLPLLLVAWIYNYSRTLTIRSRSAQVPPGRFWQVPVVGDSIQFLSGSSDDFMLPRLKKYGGVFRTHLFGCPTICTTTLEATRFVLQSKLFHSSYTDATQQIMGKLSINSTNGELHDHYRRLIQAPIISDSLRTFTTDIDRVAREQMQSWGQEATIRTAEELQKFTFHVALLFAVDSLKHHADIDRLGKLFTAIEQGFFATPINLPGTTFGRAIQARKELVQCLAIEIQKRRQEGGKMVHQDVLDSFLQAEGTGGKFTDEQVTDNILSILFAAHDTSAISLTWVIHNLLLYPEVLQQVQEENDAIARKRAHIDDPISPDDLRKLNYTNRVIQETFRTRNIVSFNMREATEDIVFNGILFPKGWKVLTWNKYVHLDPERFPEPHKFDPSRFQNVPKTHTFTPFGNGPRACPGSELAKQEMLVFLHRFVTNYNFKHSGVLDQTVSNWPMPKLKSGLPLRVTRRSAF